VAGHPDITYDYYYSGYQVVEVRKDADADPLEQYVWDGRYVHSPCLRWRDANTDGDLDDEGDSVFPGTRCSGRRRMRRCRGISGSRRWTVR